VAVLKTCGHFGAGYWATPVHHIWPLLHRDPATRPLACSLLRDFVSGVTNATLAGSADHMLSINEWVNLDGVPSGAKGYVASAANAAAAAHAMMAGGGGCPYP
jgi:hypothetical protein